MTYVDLVTALLHELDDMETELRLYNLRDLLRVSEVEGHSGKGRVEGASANETQFSASTGCSRVLGIQSCEGLEG